MTDVRRWPYRLRLVEDAGLAETAGADQRGDPALSDSLREVGDEIGTAFDLGGLERALIRERRRLHLVYATM